MALTAEQVKKMEEQLARLQKENDALKTKAAKERPFKIQKAEKGGVSVYGLGRFPVTLYVSQWETLITRIGEVKQFIELNRSTLASKPE